MRVALGSDERTHVTDAIEAWLAANGHSVELTGALCSGESDAWPDVGHRVGLLVASGDCTTGIVCCWTGTGVSMAANKVRGVRAALCTDAPTAAGAREWNDANVLALGLRLTTPALAEEILAAWFRVTMTSKAEYRAMIDRVEQFGKDAI